ncbi:hypothetical protein JTE90_004713 [Oedothorax gibbosus]|uniref:DNA transposase THAP9 n=1 Tax=Oedothorax gibbosus TaxID=931172 RepID=A0AAV6U0U1_9ARAC|nr:hypothetical protein JTE90_004713 [Oedothorax gibbosus]
MTVQRQWRIDDQLPHTGSDVIGYDVTYDTTKHRNPPKERRPADVSISSVEASGMEKNISAVEELAGVELDHDYAISVRRWYNVIDGRPGFTAEALSALKYRLDVTPYKVYFAIMFDEMAIKKHLSWDGNSFFGYSTLGADICSEESCEAKEALVFMAVGLNVSWAIPIAYFLVDGTSAQDKANLVTQAINILHDLGGTVVSLTFDGTSTNLSTAETLGAKILDPLTCKGLKGALKESNKKVWEPFLKNALTYLLQRCENREAFISNKAKDTHPWIYLPHKKPSRFGLFKQDLVEKLFQDLVFSSKINYLTAYKMSQDHLEMFFSKVRLRGGWNNTPTPIQFKSAYKQLLVKNDIRANENANVRPQKGDIISSLACLSAVVPEVDESLFHNVTLKRLFDFDMDFEEEEQIQQEPDTHIIYSDYKNNIVVYISGFVVRRVSKKIKCQQCIASLESDATAIKNCIFSTKRQRKVKKIKTLTDMINNLKSKSLINAKLANSLKETYSNLSLDILKLKSGPQKYSNESFALSLYFYSPKAYDYIRKSLSLCLPHPCTVRRWYNVIDGRPGFTADALSALKYRLDVTPYKVYFAIMFDEMAIKKHLSWDGNSFFGYSTLGADICSEESCEAKEALVFMAVGLNVSWAIPIAYFLVDGTSAQDKANLVTQAINILHDLGGTVVSLTFDGTSTNLSTAETLGAKILDPLTCKGLKGALKESNKKVWEPFLKNALTYLLQRCENREAFISNKAKDTHPWIYLPHKKPSRFGLFKQDLVEKLFQDLVFSSKINYLTAYKMSQDHLEMFFSKVRLRGGWNNTPTPIQFKSAYKQLLVKNDIRANENANVRPQKGDIISSLACLSAVVPEVDESLFHNVTLKRLFDFDMDFEEEEQIQQEPDTHIIYSDYKNNIVVYISGFVVRRVSKKIKCQQCIASLESDATAIKNCIFSTKRQRYEFNKLVVKNKILTCLPNLTALRNGNNFLHKVPTMQYNPIRSSSLPNCPTNGRWETEESRSFGRCCIYPITMSMIYPYKKDDFL